MPRTLVRSSFAVRIARLDRVAFNESVANNFYSCAPPTTKGSSRRFTEDDLVGLYIFARLMDMGMLPRHAGPLACQFKEAASANRDEDRLIYVKGQAVSRMFTGSQYDRDNAKKGTSYRGIGPVITSLEFHVGKIRQIIREAIEKERPVSERAPSPTRSVGIRILAPPPGGPSAS